MDDYGRFGVWVQRRNGVTVLMGQYASRMEAMEARQEFVNGKRAAGWNITVRGVTTFLRWQDVRLEIWIERVGQPSYSVN